MSGAPPPDAPDTPTGRPPVRVQVSADALARWGDRIGAAGPGVELVAFDPGLGAIPGDPPEAAWLSVDVLRGDDTSFTDALLASEALRFVQSAGAGTDGVTFRRLLARGVRLCTAHVNNVPIAEYVLRAVLDRFQRADRWRAGQAAHRWEHHEWREVAGSAWLVIGVGAIGAAVAERARALGATVIGVRRTPTGAEPVDEMIGPDAVAGRLGDVDVVVCALPGGPATEHLVDAAFLAAMRPDAVLVNVARGSVVDEAALLGALENGTLGGAALDVFQDEPRVPARLMALPQVVLAPHVGSATGQTRQAMADLAFGNLREHFAGRPVLSPVPECAVR